MRLRNITLAGPAMNTLILSPIPQENATGFRGSTDPMDRERNISSIWRPPYRMKMRIVRSVASDFATQTIINDNGVLKALVILD
jgi:hypothetical protein